MTITLLSRAISWSRASFNACRMLILRAISQTPSISHIDVGHQVFRRRCGRRFRGRHRGFDLGQDLLVDRLELGLLDHPRIEDLLRKELDAILMRPDVLDFTLAAIGLLIALEVAEEADHLA